MGVEEEMEKVSKRSDRLGEVVGEGLDILENWKGFRWCFKIRSERCWKERVRYLVMDMIFSAASLHLKPAINLRKSGGIQKPFPIKSVC